MHFLCSRAYNHLCHLYMLHIRVYRRVVYVLTYVYVCVSISMYIYIYTCGCISAHIDIYTYSRCVCGHVCVCLSICTYVSIRCVHVHMYICTRIYTISWNSRACQHTLMHTYIHTRIQTCMHACIHMYMYANSFVHIYEGVCMHAGIGCSCVYMYTYCRCALTFSTAPRTICLFECVLYLYIHIHLRRIRYIYIYINLWLLLFVVMLSLVFILIVVYLFRLNHARDLLWARMIGPALHGACLQCSRDFRRIPRDPESPMDAARGTRNHVGDAYITIELHRLVKGYSAKPENTVVYVISLYGHHVEFALAALCCDISPAVCVGCHSCPGLSSSRSFASSVSVYSSSLPPPPPARPVFSSSSAYASSSSGSSPPSPHKSC